MIHLKQTFRSLLKSPLVTAAAVLSLALGIGANAAIFSLFEQMLLRPLPVQEPDRLVNLSSEGPKSGSVSTGTAGHSEAVFSYPMFRDLQEAETKLSGLAAYQGFGANLAYGGLTASEAGLLVSGSYFEVLGLRPAAGRLLQPDDDRNIGAHPVVVLSHDYFTERFDRDESVIGETLVVNGRPLTVVGVAPKGFRGTTLGNLPRVFVPITMKEAVVPGWTGFDDRRSYWAYVFGRLGEGVAPEQASAAVNRVYGRILREVEAPLQGNMSEATLARFTAKTVELEPGARGQSTLHGEVRAPLLLLFGVTAFVLLIAGANLANLLLIRAGRRSGEIAVRMSIGAQRRQVVAQLLTESFVLAALGAAVGWIFAELTLAVLASLLPTQSGLQTHFALGFEAWIFVGVLSLLVGLVGLYPALQATRESYAVTLKAQSGGSSSSRAANRFRAVMATVQIALSTALLISAGLLIKSLDQVGRVELGIETEQLVTFALSPERNGYTPDQSRKLFERVEQEVAALPGVESVSLSMVPLITDNNWGSNVSVQGFEAGPDTDTNSRYNAVGPGFFRTMGIPLVAGRDIEEQDALGTAEVAVVNETFARKFGLGKNAVGTWMQVGSGGEMNIRIVGLAKDAKYSSVKDETPPVFVLPYRQDEELGSAAFYARAAGDPRSVIPAIRATVSRLDPNLPLDGLRPFTVDVEENVFLDRMLSTLSSGFALLATLLAAIGLYGVIAYTVVQRHREIGLRMALGADASRVRGWVLSRVLVMVGVGVAGGALVALALGRLGASLLFEIQGHDPRVFLAAVVTLTAVALAAGWIPAYRASRIHPIEALRDE